MGRWTNMLTDLQFAYLALNDLRPDPRNPRTHSKKQVEQIAASMTELGFARAIVINPDRTIIAGHARITNRFVRDERLLSELRIRLIGLP